MTTLYDEIVAKCTEEELAARNFHVIAAKVNSTREKKTLSKMISERGILESYPGGPLEADAVLTKLETFSLSAHPLASIVKRALKFLSQPDGLDIGSAATQGMLTQLGSGVITAEEATKLKNLAPSIDNHVTWQMCQEALDIGQ